MEKAYKFYTYLRKHGFSKTAIKTKQYLAKKTNVIKQPLDIMVDIEDVMQADFVKNPYKKPERIAKKTLDIAWVLSPMSAGSGGQNTITRFIRFLEQQGHSVTIYIYEAIHPQSVHEAKKILKESFNLDVTVKKVADYRGSDALIATGWETAYPVFNMKSGAHKFYFIQDFEPYFYGVGSKSILAENTYKMGLYGITAGRWLTHRVSTEYGMEADYFNFGADLNIYRPNDISSIKKRKKVIFYARPVTERRAYELGIIALDIFHKTYPEYEIEFFGWDTSGYQVPFPYINRGILSHHELAVLYQESVACLVLSLTNVSLLPLELLAAGCIPVMNRGDNNSMVLGENANIRYAEPIPTQLAEVLSQVIGLNDLENQAMKAVESVKTLSWDDSYKKVESIILDEVTKR